ncbi:hypothetical protein [Halomicrobium salinisoli]|uniref:hypothetical protein n=1 Tax=Halomicrobium salinisoli TaxID=2878391 RepID=UPI001CF0C12D|nr:hypothetical protein [Halomicrobium salinisoli]
MVLEALPGVNRNTFDQLAGITGIGWTTSLLGFLSSVVGYGNGVISRLVTDPSSLLYLGGLFFLTTLGLDRLANRLSED